MKALNKLCESAVLMQVAWVSQDQFWLMRRVMLK